MTPADSSACVLLIDDDESIVAAMKMLLRVSGYRVQTAESPAQARTLVAEGLRPELIVSDYQLGVMGATGIDVVLELRTVLGRDVPAIVTTGDVSGILEPRVAAMSACQLLVKPFDPQTFIDRVDAILSRA